MSTMQKRVVLAAVIGSSAVLAALLIDSGKFMATGSTILVIDVILLVIAPVFTEY